MSKMLRALILSAVIVGLIAAPAMAGKVKFGHVAPPFHGQHRGILAFAEHVKAGTDGRIDIAVFPLGQLGPERSMAEQVQNGTLQIAAITTAVLGNFAPHVTLFDLPFIYPNRATAYATLADAELQKKFFEPMRKKGFTAIGWTENEFRDFTNSKRVVRRPEDIKGLKVRVMKAPVCLDTFEALGAPPVGMPFPEIYNALQQGVIDGQDNPILTSILMKFTEVNKHVTLTKHSLTSCIIVVNNDYWDSLSAADQAVFRQAAIKCIDINRKVNAGLHQKLPKSGISIEEYCRQKGITLVTLTEDERLTFRKASAPVWEKYRKRAGGDYFDFLMARIKAHTVK